MNQTRQKGDLSEMSLAELWELFPIILTEHQSCWKDYYLEEYIHLKKILPMENIERICHIGSTAIDTIWAKPIVDILIETSLECNQHCVKQILLDNGYLCMSEDEERSSFNKGYTKAGFAKKVFHLHLRKAGDHDELYFRNYLMKHPEIAREYEALKLELWTKFEHDRDAYTESKTRFIKKYTMEAKKEDMNL